MDQTRRAELGDKLVWHSKGPLETALEYNRYVVNDNLFRTVVQDEGKKPKTVACVYLQLMTIPIMES
jgi:hypothetical protein